MINSYKTILFLSTAAISSTAYSLILFPSLTLDFFDLSSISALITLVLSFNISKTYLAQIANESPISKDFIFSDAGLTLFSSEFTLNVFSNSLPLLDFFFAGLNFLAIVFFIDLFSNILTSNLKSLFWFKPYNFLKTNLFLSYTFISSIDTILAFVYFFFSLYFLELHFFFVYSLNMSSDSLVYQFNFLLSSFFFIFIVKTLRGLLEKGFIFSMSFQFNEYNQFYSSEIDKFAFESAGGNIYTISIVEEGDYMIMVRAIFRLFFFIFFFFSTFFVWLLRFIIQFVRLLVLFMIHTIFELVIVSADVILSTYATNYLFAFKYLFFIFFFFGSFLYLIIYLNLMFTLQVFIFYFFSEVFQSNFITDLSSFVATKLKKI